MAYIGRDTDKISNVEVLDNITFDGSSSYTLQKGGSNFTPSSANTLLVSINGVVQAGNFTVSGSTIDFGTAVAGTSTCDFILHYGIGLITSVSDGTVTTAKLADSSVSLAKLTATGTKDATTFLRGDNTFDVPPLGGITMIDQWRIIADANYAGGTNDITGTWERNDTDGAGLLGSAMSVSSGVFTFPSTGYYYITAGFFLVRDNTTSRFNVLGIRTTQNNSSYNDRVQLGNHVEDIAVQHTFVYADYIFDVTDTSTHKAKFVLENDGSITLGGDTSKDRSFVRFIRLGDT
jgi:hypothetical protein